MKRTSSSSDGMVVCEECDLRQFSGACGVKIIVSMGLSKRTWYLGAN